MVSPALNRCRDGSITYLTLNGFEKLFLNCGSDNHRIAVTKSNDNRILLAKLNLIGALLNISLRLGGSESLQSSFHLSKTNQSALSPRGRPIRMH
jgi:hypothetical protein